MARIGRLADHERWRVARHYPLMLLGLPSVADHRVDTCDPVVV